MFGLSHLGRLPPPYSSQLLDVEPEYPPEDDEPYPEPIEPERGILTDPESFGHRNRRLTTSVPSDRWLMGRVKDVRATCEMNADRQEACELTGRARLLPRREQELSMFRANGRPKSLLCAGNARPLALGSAGASPSQAFFVWGADWILRERVLGAGRPRPDVQCTYMCS